ncbi:MAG: CerR family C-terminal domain-containing protein [Planctomycetes bacterium]|nr:CerR family C-terminal domain-containing protein [Planctomycetota bacterium]
MTTEMHKTATRDRLLASARRVFAEKGYHHATVAEICERAGANIAAVNYYFRSKDTLYVEAWQSAFQRSIAAHPPDGGVPADAPPDERLRGRIRSLTHRVADPESQEFDIIHKELASPTGLLTETLRTAIEPIRQGFSSIVRELLGPRASDTDVRLCEKSTITQCMHFMMRERFYRLSPDVPPPGPPPLGLDTNVVADHVFRFSLAGIREIRRQVESGDDGEPEPRDGAR